ncbi:MAG: tRNA (adenosine(37)-N6)-threonylcarbamoyltransferase complex ATPase subunit type 1 TsaE [Clostridiales bacterium]|jgi:tRNA threonylcarbamoyladenosine biosynthesis protein TsaE|nr:tRNA (adenosine(37)-N6)-threonylcarbamoyltransferase complex ATPase subunit type 1 TsaE [Clostridiales bacterium]
MVYNSGSEAETLQIGEKISKILKPGDVVGILGEMGAGKTVLVRGIARGLGYNGRVTSPTYTIVNEYPTSPLLFHFDLYRLGSASELYDIGFEDYIARGGICAVEWFEKAQDEFDCDVEIFAGRVGEDDNKRRFTVTARGRDVL